MTKSPSPSVEPPRRHVIIHQDDYNVLTAKARVCDAWRDWKEPTEPPSYPKELLAALADLEKMESKL